MQLSRSIEPESQNRRCCGESVPNGSSSLQPSDEVVPSVLIMRSMSIFSARKPSAPSVKPDFTTEALKNSRVFYCEMECRGRLSAEWSGRRLKN